jgi:hypothetical protein
MEYKSLDQIRDLAEVRADLTPQPTLSHRQRLQRWAEVLQRHEGRQLRSLMGTEFVSRDERVRMRVDNSPLTVAFEDPILRADGLKGDRFGDAIEFFGVAENDVHNLVCYCRHGRTMMAEAVARDVRTLATYKAIADFVTTRTVVAGASALAAVAMAATFF